MNVESNEFFRQAAARICGSLNIKNAMKNCMDYIKDFIPVDIMDLRYFDPNLNVLKNVASISCNGSERVAEVLPMPERGLEERVLSWNQIKNIEIVNRPALHPDISIMFTRIGIPLDVSLIIMRLDHGNRHVGNLALYASGNDRYLEEHSELLYMLHDLFAIVTANIIQNLELIQLKNVLADDNRYLQHELLELTGSEIVGAGFGLQNVMEMVRQVAPLNSPVLLTGETGVGKDVLANAIHQYSPRSAGPFIKVNCGAIPDNLMDSELFGHEKGAFTGAVTQKRGRFERSHKGTIFLDEVGELTPQAQIRLLHVLQHHEIERVGGTASIPVNIRIISATNKNLEAMVDLDQFREDLWFRLNVFPIMIPPLRHRKEDIPTLVHYFIEKKSIEIKIKRRPVLALGAMDQLMEYHWPGNVRELENVVERALILQSKGPLTFEGLLNPSQKNLVKSGVTLNRMSELLPLNEMIKGHIKQALKRAHGKISGHGGAAEMLQIHPNTLRQRMDKLGIPYGKRYKG